MAYFHRLILIAFFCLPAFINNAHAGTFIPPIVWTNITGQPSTVTNIDKDATCKLAANYLVKSQGIGSIQKINSCTDNTGTLNVNYNYYVNSTGATNPFNQNIASGVQSCPAGTTHTANTNYPNYSCTDTCVLPAVWDSYAGSCQNPNTVCDTSKLTGDYGIHVRSDITQANATLADAKTTACQNGCEVKLDAFGSPFYLTSSGANRYIKGSLVQTGNKCKATTEALAATSTPQAEKDCQSQGKGYISVGGVTTCVANGTAGATNPVKVSDATVSTGTGTSNTTTSTVVNTDNSVTTTTTITNPDGSQATTKKDESKPSFCEANPTSKICKDDASDFGGACNGFTCTGDAIQCAIAKKVYQNKCDDLKDLDDAKTALQVKNAYTTGQKLMDEDFTQDVKDFQNHTGTSSRTINVPTSLSESGSASFGGDEIHDVTKTVMGKTFTVPFSNANYYFNIFGYVLLGLAYLSAYKIATSSI